MFPSGVFFHLLLNTKQEMHFISFKRPRSANIRSWRVSEEEENIDNQKTQNKIHHQKKMNKLKMIIMRLCENKVPLITLLLQIDFRCLW